MSNEQDSSSLDLHTALREAFAEQAAREESERTALAQEIESKPEAEEQEVPEAKGGAQETASADTEQKAKQDEHQKGAIEPPSHWSEEHKELFRRQSPEAQQFVLERHKAMEGDYTRKSQEIAEQRKRFETIQAALEPYRPMLQQRGINEQDAIRALFEAQRMLDTDPKAGIARLAQSYGVSLDKPEGAFVDPDLQSVRSEVENLRRELALRDQQARQAQQQSLQQTIQQFQDAKDAKGEPAHPHFDKVKGVIGALLTSGAASDLEDAYQQAVFANPELRKQILEAERSAAAEKAKAEAAKHAEEARKKAIPTGKGATASAAKEPQTLREQLQAEWRARQTGTRI